MRKMLIALAIIGVATAPAMAQTTVPAPGAAAAKPKTVTKEVCRTVRDEATTGSRLSKPTKVCRKVEVPASDAKAQTQGEGHRAHAN